MPYWIRRGPGGGPENITKPPWSHSISQSAVTVTSARTNGLWRDVYSIGAVDVSRSGGLRQRSVSGRAAREKYSRLSGNL